MALENELNLVLAKFRKIVDPVIKRVLISGVDKKFHDIVSYQISTGGKRLRPALAIISCLALGGKIKDVLYPAAGLEILHNYTLIIDDMIDNDQERRGKPTLWSKFGESIAQCVGIDYGTAVFQAAKHSNKYIKISELFALLMKDITDGQILDILFEQQGRYDESYVLKNRYSKITEKDYFKMVSQKTASLFQTCCEVGGICAKASEKRLEALKNFGLNLGIAFQIQDDILDIFGEPNSRKTSLQGKDILERKGGNIVILIALNELSSKERENFLKIFKKEKIEGRDIRGAIKLIKKTSAFQKANLLGRQYIEKAKKYLQFFPKNKWRNLLEDFANFAMKREK